MKIEGSIAANLEAAIRSAERLRKSRVHSDTLIFWRDVMAHARAEIRRLSAGEAEAVEPLIARLQSLLIARDPPL